MFYKFLLLIFANITNNEETNEMASKVTPKKKSDPKKTEIDPKIVTLPVEEKNEEEAEDVDVVTSFTGLKKKKSVVEKAKKAGGQSQEPVVDMAKEMLELTMGAEVRRKSSNKK